MGQLERWFREVYIESCSAIHLHDLGGAELDHANQRCQRAIAWCECGYSPDSEAYRLYLQGRYNWNKRTVEGLQKGIQYFGEAIQRDQDYGLAYAGLADCYLLLNVYNVTSADDSYPKAEAASKRALSINESLALNPNYATAHQFPASLVL